MDIWGVLKIVGFTLVLAFINFGFRPGQKLKPDRDARDNGGGGDGGHGGGHGGGSH